MRPRSTPVARSSALLWALAAALTACGASRSGEPAKSAKPAPAEAPRAEPEAAGAPAEERSMDTVAPRSAPAPAAAGAPLPSSTKAEREAGPAGDAAGAADDFTPLTRQLEGALALSAPDCTTAWAMRDRICDLSQRLCDLAGRSAEPDIAERCTDGRSRCERATARVRAACAE